MICTRQYPGSLEVVATAGGGDGDGYNDNMGVGKVVGTFVIHRPSRLLLLLLILLRHRRIRRRRRRRLSKYGKERHCFGAGLGKNGIGGNGPKLVYTW